MDRHECQNCKFMGREEELINPIPDLYQRVGPGEPMPSGECPACGAVCHPTKNKFPAPVRLMIPRDAVDEGHCEWFQTDLAAAESMDEWFKENPTVSRFNAEITSFPGKESKKKRLVESQADLLRLAQYVFASCEETGCADGTATISAEAFNRLKAVCGG